MDTMDLREMHDKKYLLINFKDYLFWFHSEYGSMPEESDLDYEEKRNDYERKTASFNPETITVMTYFPLVIKLESSVMSFATDSFSTEKWDFFLKAIRYRSKELLNLTTAELTEHLAKLASR